MTETQVNLTPKQELFCMEYLKDFNGTQAAIRAGYSKKTANEQASRLLANVNISNLIAKMMQEKKSKVIAEQDEILETLTRILRRQEKETIVVTLKSHKTYYDKRGKKVVTDKETPEVVGIPTRIGDVNKAAELLGKRYGLFVDKVQNVAPPQIVDDIPQSEDISAG